MDMGHERQQAPTTLGGLIVEFFRHSSGAILAVVALFALIGYMYFEGAANPAGNMRHVPVAVVNEDAGASIDTPIGARELHIGDQLVGGMLDGNDFSRVNLRVVDRQTAEDGMRTGKFFGMVEVPESFSQDLGDVITSTAGNDGTTEAAARPRITVYTAPRTAVTAPQVMAALTGVLQQTLPEQVGPQVLDNARTLAEAEHTELSPTAASALADPIAIEQQTFDPLTGGATNPSFPLFYSLILILAGFTGAMVISQLLDSRLGFVALEVGPLVRLAPLGTHSRLRVLFRKWAVTLIIAPLVAVVTALIAHGVGVTEFPFWPTVAFSTLTIISVGTAAHAINSIAGNPGLVINLIVFIVIGIPTSGGAIPTEMLPAAFAAIGTFEPMHQATAATRALLFFEQPWESGMGTATWVMLGWMVAALVIGTAVVWWYDRAGYERKPTRTRASLRKLARSSSPTAEADASGEPGDREEKILDDGRPADAATAPEPSRG